jgi:hypothetical protein
MKEREGSLDHTANFIADFACITLANGADCNSSLYF